MDLTFISKAVSGLIQTVRGNLIASLLTTILFVIVVTVSATSYVVATNFTAAVELVERYFPNTQDEARNAQAAIPVGKNTCNEIQRIQIQTGADRGSFWIFTNHSTTLNGNSFNNSTLFCQSVADGIAALQPVGPIPNSMSAEIMETLFPNAFRTECGKWNVDELTSTYLRASLRSVGTDVIYECGVRDNQNVQLGKIILSWHNRLTAPPDEVVFKAIRQASERIGALNSIPRS